MIDWTKTDITKAVIDLQKFYSLILLNKKNASLKTDQYGQLLKEIFVMGNSLVFVVRYNESGEIKRVEMQVSLHKYFEEGYNYSDFQFKHLFQSVSSICITYGINPLFATILNIEAGFNVIPPTKTDTFLNGLYFYKTVPFTEMKNKFRFKVGIEATLSDYVVKCYNKRSQLLNRVQMPTELLRYEVHFNKMRKVNKCGIYCLADLLDHTKIYKLSKLVLSTLEDLVHFEPTAENNQLNTVDKKLMNQWKNPKQISKLMKNNSQKYRRQKRRFKQLSSQIERSALSEIKKAIHVKEKQLLQLDSVTIKQAKFFLTNYKK